MTSKVEILEKMIGKTVDIEGAKVGDSIITTSGVVKKVIDAETLLVDIPIHGEVEIDIWDIRQ